MNDKSDVSVETDAANKLEKRLLKWRRRNAYYYNWLNRIHEFIVRPDSRVLHVGCECGDLLNAVKPSRGVGVNSDPQTVEIAQKRFPHLHFKTAEPCDLGLDETFDYILICNSLGQWNDIQQVFEHVRSFADEHTRIIVTYYSYLWEGVMRLGTLLKLRQPKPYQNWLPPSDIVNLLRLSDFDVIRSDSHVMMPKWIPLLSTFCNYVLSMLPGFRLSQMSVLAWWVTMPTRILIFPG